MAGYVKRIRTTSGDLQIDYNALANLPQPTTLSDLGVSATSDELNTLMNVKRPVQTQLDEKLNNAGGTMSGQLNMGNNKITNLQTPSVASDAATAQYVTDVTLQYRGLLKNTDVDNPNLHHGIYQLGNGVSVQNINDGLLIHNVVVPNSIVVQTVLSSSADSIWIRTYWKGSWNSFRNIGFNYGTELPAEAQDGQLFFVKV